LNANEFGNLKVSAGFPRYSNQPNNPKMDIKVFMQNLFLSGRWLSHIGSGANDNDSSPYASPAQAVSGAHTDRNIVAKCR
jgi:hypothetical protein